MPSSSPCTTPRSVRERKRPKAIEGLFRVLVPADDVGDALRRLRAEGLPRDESRGFEEVFGEGGLVPTATEEQARYVAALGGELSASIETMEGVLDARVHIALPDRRRVSLDDSQPQARASVLIKYRGESPPYDDAAIRALVSGAVQRLSTDDVAVVGVSTPVLSTTARRLVSVGPFTVTRGSASGLRMALAGALVLHLILAALLVLVVMRRKQSTAAAEQLPPNSAAV